MLRTAPVRARPVLTYPEPVLTSPCPCRILEPAATAPALEQCCGRFHARAAWPATAEQLMRSRYSAFVLGLDDWVFVTWHPRTRPADVDASDGDAWRGLEIVATEAGGPEDETGVVEFVAHHAGGRMHERSRFARRAGRWLYLDGEVSTT